MAGGLTTFRVASIEVSDDGTEWHEVPGVNSISKSGGDGSQQSLEALGGVSQISTKPGAPNIAVTLVTFLPHHSAMKIVEDAAQSGEDIQYRITTQAERVLQAAAGTVGGGSVAIAEDTGICTFAGTTTPDFTKPELNVGLVIKVGSTRYVVDKITSAGVVSVTPAPDSAVAAAVYDIVLPQLRETGHGQISAAPNYDAGVGAVIGGGFTISASVRGRPAIVT